MRKKGSFFVLLSIGLCLFFMTSCKEDVPILSTIEVTDITGTSAMSGGNISDDKGATVSVRGVCWGTNQNPTIQNNKTSDGSGVGSFTSSITGLEPNTTYYVRAYATNSAGTGYGSTISFKTKSVVSYGSFTDSRDGNVYKTVTIGNQVWMAENLRYLPSVVDPCTQSIITPYYYVYDYYGTSVSEAKNTSSYTTYGVLYNWPAACSSCPSGWHLPSDAEWTELIEYLGGEDVAGGKLKEAGTSHWNSPNEGATNEVGFTALPGGYRFISGGFDPVGSNGYWWSASEYDGSNSLYSNMLYTNSYVNRSYGENSNGLSVRCVKD